MRAISKVLGSSGSGGRGGEGGGAQRARARPLLLLVSNSLAKSTALTKYTICLMNFYKEILKSSAPLPCNPSKGVGVNDRNHIYLDCRGRWIRDFLLEEPEIRDKVMDLIHGKCDRDVCVEPGIRTYASRTLAAS